MRKLILILFVMFVFLSCATGTPYPENIESNAKKVVMFDEDLTKEQCVGLWFSYWITIKSWNGIPVNWDKFTTVYLPPGKTTFILDADMGSNKVINVPFQWDFKAGERYYITLRYFIKNNNLDKFNIALITPGSNKDDEYLSYEVDLTKESKKAIVLE